MYLIIKCIWMQHSAGNSILAWVSYEEEPLCGCSAFGLEGEDEFKLAFNIALDEFWCIWTYLDEWKSILVWEWYKFSHEEPLCGCSSFGLEGDDEFKLAFNFALGVFGLCRKSILIWEWYKISHEEPLCGCSSFGLEGDDESKLAFNFALGVFGCIWMNGNQS